MTAALAFAVFWISPRGFANEGTYVYGLRDDICAHVTTSANAVYQRESAHRTLDHARDAAQSLARRLKAHAKGEQSFVSAESLKQHIADSVEPVLFAAGWLPDALKSGTPT